MLRSCGTQPMPARARRSGGSAVTSRPGQADRAAEAPRDADDRVEQRRLAHAVAAEHGERPSLREPQRQAAQHHRGAVAGDQVLHRQDVRRGGMPGAFPEINLAHPRVVRHFRRGPFREQRAGARARRCGRRSGTRGPCRARSAARTRRAGRAATIARIPSRSASGTPAAGSSSSSTRGPQAMATRDLQETLPAVGQRGHLLAHDVGEAEAVEDGDGLVDHGVRSAERAPPPPVLPEPARHGQRDRFERGHRRIRAGSPGRCARGRAPPAGPAAMR